MCIQSKSTTTISPPPPPPMYCYNFFHYYSIPVPAVVSYPILPLSFFPCSPPSYSLHNPIYPLQHPFLLSPPTANATSTTTKKNFPQVSSEMLIEVKNKDHSTISADPRHRGYAQKVLPRRMLSKSSNADPPLMWRPKATNFEREDKTTIMVKNIPNKMSQKVLIEFLDKHCSDENQRNENKDDYYHVHVHVPSEYDFVYLPIDFSSGLNMGYAFVNFTSAVAVTKFYHSCQNKKWEGFNSRKVCDTTLARIQGKEELIKNFARPYFVCNSDEFLPAVFTPPRSGGADSTSPSYLGKRWNK